MQYTISFVRRRILPFVCMLLLLMPLSVIRAKAGEDSALGWYIKKTEDHTPPPLDAPLAFIRDCGGYDLDRNASDDDPVIYLTFDAGYENGNVARILDVLKSHRAPGAFFVLSHLVRAEPALVLRMAEEGHTVCNHSASHRDMTTLDADTFRSELDDLAALYRAVTGKTLAPYFRPPEGKFSETVLRRAQDAGYKTVFWWLEDSLVMISGLW